MDLDERIAVMTELFDGGLTYAQIALMFDLSTARVYVLINPSKKKRKTRRKKPTPEMRRRWNQMYWAKRRARDAEKVGTCG